MLTVTPAQAMGRRIERLHLLQPAADPVAVASRLGGVHAQVASAAALIVGVRTSSSAPADLDEALWKGRTLVKTWGMRGTLHYFPAAELPLWVAAFRQRQWPKFTPAWGKYHGVTPGDLRAVTGAVGDVLPGRTLTREELAGEVADALCRPELAERIRSGWGQMLKPAAAGGLLCFGPDRDRNVTFTDPRTWLPDVAWDEPDPDGALRTVITRFLDTYGPATHEDFGRWWGIDAASARRIFAQHADAMVAVDVAGRKAWLTPKVAATIDSHPPANGVLLLPGFDPYTVAPISARAYTIPDGFVDRVSRTAGWISPVFVVDGVIRGVWTHERKGDTVAVEITPFARVSSSVKKDAATFVQRYGTILSGDLTLTWAAA
ncbi:MAG: winged helix DNA-binding domain-containing protein [Jiangellaceae bacterium]